VLTPGIIDDGSFTEEEKQADRRARRTMLAVLGLLGICAAVGIGLAIHFVQSERQRTLQQWQVRLGIVADSRASDVAQWLDSQYTTMRDLAQNASLQMYVGGLTAGAKDTQTVEGGYLRNLLTATAQRDGFIPSRPKQQINANVAITGTSGLAILDTSGKALVATNGMPALPPEFVAAQAQAMQGKPGLVDAQLGGQGLPVIGFAMPVYSIQGDAGVTPNIGFVVGLKELGQDLFGRLAQPGDTSETAETYLVRRNGDEITYLSPLADGSEPLKRQLSTGTADLADAYALNHPGDFAQGRDYRGHDVLFASRPIAGSPWVLVRKIDRAEALGDSEKRLAVILTTLIVAVAAAIALSLFLWRQGTSVRLAKAVSRNKAIMEKMKRAAEFLQLVSDAQPTAIATIDMEGRYTFANRHAADEANSTSEAVLGKTMGEVLGPFKANLYKEINQSVLKGGAAISQTHTFDGTPPRIVRSEHIPLMEGGQPAGVLMIEQDVTDLFHERDRAEKTLEGLVTTLVGLLDSRVPFSSNHSSRVAMVSKAIATEMGATPEEIRTAEVTGNLINLGKLLVPHEILTKTSALSDEEREVVRRSLLDTAKMLEGVDFDIPVAAALSQAQERWDGTGYPNGLKGDEINLSARVVSLANGFVSLISARSFREAMSAEKACNILLSDAGWQYDRRTVAALMNYLFNRGGAEQLGAAGSTVVPDETE
jgi:HD-GYP domain-containing protein (c-di-GMP phosphodiesterase class II)